MANLRFNVKVYLSDPAALPELKARMADMSPAFEAIFQRWVDINEQKFEQARGGELGGAQIFEEFWAGLSPAYERQKHPQGAPKRKVTRGGTSEFPDWLLVRTGALMEAMTNPDRLFQDIGPDTAVFGTPEDPELADIVRWQAGARQHMRNIIFLSGPDMNAIRKNIQDYLGMGGEFAQKRFTAGLQASALEREVLDMDAEFNEQAGA